MPSMRRQKNRPYSVDAKSRIPQADGIRGFAIIQVVVWHYFAGNSQLLLLTWSGVDLFFVLSGYLIGGILLDNSDSTNYYRVFYTRRFFRIVPLYFLVLAIGGIQHLYSATGAGIDWLYYVCLVQNFWIAANASWDLWLPQSWSLSVEEQFYFAVPFLIRVVPRRKLPWLIVGLIILAIICRIEIDLNTEPNGAAIKNYVLLPCRMDSLLIAFYALGP